MVVCYDQEVVVVGCVIYYGFWCIGGFDDDVWRYFCWKWEYCIVFVYLCYVVGQMCQCVYDCVFDMVCVVQYN